MIITLCGNQREIRSWIRRQQRMTGKKLNYTGIKTDQEECVYTIQEGTKKDCPRQRIIRRHIEKPTIDAAQIAHETRKQTEALIEHMKEDSTMEEKALELITRTQEILRFRLDTGEECEAMPVRTEEDGTIYVFVDCLKEEMYMNPTDTMEGGYEASFMRGYLNNEVLSHFPEELEDLLIPVNSMGDLLTLPSKEEIFGDPEDPEKQWPAMKLRRNRIAFQGLNGDPEWYWLRSVNSASRAASVIWTGYAYGWNASYVFGVRPAFKIANR